MVYFGLRIIPEFGAVDGEADNRHLEIGAPLD